MSRVFGSKKRQFGDRGEKLAERFLRWRGYRIIERNVITGKVGEIDLIAVHRGTLIFIEVKTRRSLRFGSAEEAVSETKLEKLERAIAWYLQLKGLERARYRLDIIAIDWSENRPKIRHHKNVSVG